MMWSLFLKRWWVLAPMILVWGLLSTAAAEPIHITSQQQTFEPFTGRTLLSGGVHVVMKGTDVTGSQAQIQLANGDAQQASFSGGTRLVKQADNGIRQTIQAGSMNMGLKTGTMEAHGGVKTQLSGDNKMGAVSIDSDSQLFDPDNHIMRAIGHVRVRKQDVEVTSPEAIVFLGAGGGAEKVTFTKGARMLQGAQEMTAHTITVNLTTGDVYAEKNAKSTMSGKDKQGNPTTVHVASTLQELNRETGMLIANGHAVIIYEDYTATGPKAVFYRKNETLDKIVLTGRAQIEDTQRRVTGDKVIITVDPKQFDAQGNVTTFIKTRPEGTPSPAGKTAKTKPSATKTISAKPPRPGASAVASAKPAPSAMDQELLIEQASQADRMGKTP